MLGPGIPKTLRQDTHLSCCVQSKVAAVHACVPELKRRRAELEAELAISIARHQVLTDELPWHKQLVRSQHYTASNSQKNNMEYEFLRKHPKSCKGCHPAWQTSAAKPNHAVIHGRNEAVPKIEESLVAESGMSVQEEVQFMASLGKFRLGSLQNTGGMNAVHRFMSVRLC